MSEFVSSSIASANTRSYKVKAFLAKPPKRAAFLRLVAAGEEDEAQVPLGEWQEGEIVPELALEILELLDGHALEMQTHITANLSYVDQTGKIVRSMVLKRQGNHVVGEGTGLLGPEEMNSQLTGDARSQAQSAQRHLEVMGRVYMAGIASLLTHSERIVQRQAEMLETLASRLGRAERRIDAKEAEVMELVEVLQQLQESSADKQNPAMERAWSLFERLAPTLMQQVLSGAAPRPAAEAAE